MFLCPMQVNTRGRIRYCLTTDCGEQKILVMKGDGENGKDTILDVMRAIICGHNISHLSVHDLADKFRIAELARKYVNFAVEIDRNRPVDTAMLKAVTGGTTVTAERKYQDPFSFRPFAKWIIACNHCPLYRDDSHGYGRRFTILPFDGKIPPERRQRNFQEQIIEEELSAVFNYAYAALVALNERRGKGLGFARPKASLEALEEYKDEISREREFIRDHLEAGNTTDNVRAKEVYRRYVEWCHDNGFSAKNSVNLYRTALEMFGLGKDCKRKVGGDIVIYGIRVLP